MNIRREAPFHFKNFLNLIRALFPHWNFFDRIAHSFAVEYKVSTGTQWQRLAFSQKRANLGIFLNPNLNESLAQVNVIEHFVKNIQDLQTKSANIQTSSIETLSSYKILLSILRLKLQDGEVSNKKIQFKIVANNDNENLDIFVSSEVQL